jgi:Tol biopolymer transport system component
MSDTAASPDAARAGSGDRPGRAPARRALREGQVARLVVVDADTREQRVVLETDRRIEAPNWTPDGRWLVVNADGKLYTVAADGRGELREIPVTGLARANNDHCLAPDGRTIYVSAEGHLYAVPLEGGPARRITRERPAGEQYWYFLHGVSPDGTTLAYVAVQRVGADPMGRRNLALLPAAGGDDVLLTDGTGFDGPEYSPDGRWLYYNSEEAATAPGHAQLFRRRPDGSGREQLTFDERVNWFPHPAPDGRSLVYLSYPPGTIGHPADVDVSLRRLPAGGGEPRTIADGFGGQGTMNVNSWAPDSVHFACVLYPIRPAPSSGAGTDVS